MKGTSSPRFPRKNLFFIILISIAMLGLAMIPSSQQETASHVERKFKIGKPYPIDIATASATPLSGKDKTDELIWKKHVIESGESLAIAFDNIGLDGKILHSLINTDANTKQLERLRPGNILQFGFNKEGKLVELRQPRNHLETLIVRHDGSTFSSEMDKKEIETHINFSHATIKTSFWSAADKAGLTANQIMEIAALFGWDIDFALDIRAGDKFEVLFEQHYLDGYPVDRGEILAATFTNMGQTFTAVRNNDGKYYDKDGLAMRKAFLRSPVNFRYVSSNFNPRRLHPVTGKVKPHRGTDYVAPVGTPIWAAGDGVVLESAYNKYNGNYVFIKHSAKYVTKYLHLTKRMVKKGQRVKQGDTVGTLGGTGRVTGPHLHYEFLVNGQHKNPRTVDLPQANSLSGNEQVTFKKQAKQQLDHIQQLGKLVVNNDILLN
ncbi:peptidase M23 [Photobacterium sp. GB-27]|nr:peptidase M23 [Photobacterium sp. GB-56]PSV31084.1 peptidase M23 [Photobacterium sp. GB-72]PSV33764.1 peptidase M23 [Photobacterium sp. GB-210]PSV36953.1 peptidase M23 [Photobacterium sp. GB-27]PSV44024.1 peptidase M23 [Photobacterium sp. GB-36]PSV52600.1 peptidase M23 [Photobacterium sp. GB-1]PSW72868.1 peptidase M23 [Photobacterium sp. GB-50]